MRLCMVLAIVALAVSQAGAQVLIGNNPSVSDGGLNVAPPGVWVKVGDGPNARLSNDRGGADGGDWAVGGSDGSGSSPPYDNYYSQTFVVPTDLAAGEYLVNLSGWSKAWAGWWSGENWNWIQEARVQLWIDDSLVWEGVSSNNTNRDIWTLHSHAAPYTVNSSIEVRLRSVKGNDNFGNGTLGAIWYDSRYDDITLEISSTLECTNPSTITSIDPDSLEFTLDTSYQNITVFGTNLEDVTGVRLIGPVTRAADVLFDKSSTQVSASFDLGGAPFGTYDVQVLRALPCSNVTAEDLFTITPLLFTNGSFEQGDPGDETDIPGWIFLVDRPGPTIRKRSGEGVFGDTAAPFDGDFYAGNSHGDSGNFHVALAQSFKTTPGATYTVTGGHFGGVFAPDGGVNGLVWWEVLIVDGITQDMNAEGTIIAKREHPPSGGYLDFRETFDEAPTYNGGQFTAAGNAATIFLKWGHDQGSWSYNLAGWDALDISVPCNSPWADADGDGDVDHDDFAIFQQCYTGAGGNIPEGDVYPCFCFDRNGDQLINDTDFNAFVACVSGPSVPADPCP